MPAIYLCVISVSFFFMLLLFGFETGQMRAWLIMKQTYRLANESG